MALPVWCVFARVVVVVGCWLTGDIAAAADRCGAQTSIRTDPASIKEGQTKEAHAPPNSPVGCAKPTLHQDAGQRAASTKTHPEFRGEALSEQECFSKLTALLQLLDNYMLQLRLLEAEPISRLDQNQEQEFSCEAYRRLDQRRRELEIEIGIAKKKAALQPSPKSENQPSESAKH